MKKFLLSLLAFVLISTVAFAASGTKEYGNYFFLNGDVGINTTVPATKLDVAGVVTSTGLTIGSAAIAETELEIIDGATLSTTQLNYLNLAGGTTGTTSTNLVFSTSPTFVTPALGTPSSGNFANCTFPTLNQNTTGNAGTATALAANGANCSAGNAPLGVDESGAIESCFDVWTEAENTSAAYISGNESIAFSGDVSGSGTTAITTTIGADKILESMLKSVNTPTDEYYLTYEATTGDFEWQTVAGGGDVSKVGTPADNQIGVWTGDGTIEGDSALTFNTTTDTLSTTTFAGALTGTASGNLVAGGALGTPSSGNLANCTFPTLNQSTTGNAGTATALATARNIYGNSFNGTAALTQIIASTFGGTGNGFTKFTGATDTEKTYTLPNSNATLLYSGGALGTPSGGSAANLTSFPTLNQDTTGSAASLSATLSIGSGGTGATTASAALTNLGGIGDVVDDTTPDLGGELDAGAHSIGFTLQSATGDGTTTVDWKLGNKFKFTFGAQNDTFTFTAPTNPCSIQLVLVQDGIGSRTATFPSTVKWAGGSAPTLSTAASSVDIVSCIYDGTNYYCTASLDFS